MDRPREVEAVGVVEGTTDEVREVEALGVVEGTTDEARELKDVGVVEGTTDGSRELMVVVVFEGSTDGHAPEGEHSFWERFINHCDTSLAFYSFCPMPCLLTEDFMRKCRKGDLNAGEEVLM